ncbi:DUF262 domain-containing protein [Corynebacterium timonense]|uniref:GmrSD restriction endonucleases N-terminal domain-containing protein n=1 Tax=Corynebacterium timonense TaxID=441500 RepID=A0A1H1PXQ3_9CORY|nr:DUF262 domain-containing protein [Corynebacterium timonense]SDS16151.1 hypothetical protein SAMN04488539_1132 [Corynebacterium timonense]
MGFTTPSYPLPELFARAERGELQLPDFQRDYVWDVDRVRSLVASVLRGHPIGSLLALDTRNVPMRFRARPLRGAPDTGREPGLVLLDGQQRLTSLYHALRGNGVVPALDFRGRLIERRFFVDVEAAAVGGAAPLPIEAIFAVDTDGTVRSHFGPDVGGPITSREQMVAHGVIPVSWLLGAEGANLLVDMAAQAESPQRLSAVRAFHRAVLSQIVAYAVPVVRIDRETSLAGVGQIFAYANVAGVQMDVFDLLGALFAMQDPGFDVGAQWRGVEKQLREHPALDGIGRIEFLRAMALLLTARRGAAAGHRGDILNISLEDYREHVAELVAAFERAAEFLEERCFITPEQVPYPAQIVSLAAIMARLGEGGEEPGGEAVDRLNRWLWCGLFGELYGGHAPTTRSGADVDEVVPWVRGATEELPRTVENARLRQSRLLTAGPSSGVYRGLYALVMARGARDWRTGEEFNAETRAQLEPGFYEVFPRGFCEAHGVSQQLAESVLNRTPMGIRTKVLVENNGPKRYLPRLQSKSLMDDAEFDAMLAGHQLDPALARSSDHERFFADRLSRFTDIVEYSMGTPVIRDLGQGEDTMATLSSIDPRGGDTHATPGPDASS